MRKAFREVFLPVILSLLIVHGIAWMLFPSYMRFVAGEPLISVASDGRPLSTGDRVKLWTRDGSVFVGTISDAGTVGVTLDIEGGQIWLERNSIVGIGALR